MRCFSLDEAEELIPKLEQAFAAVSDIKVRAEAKVSAISVLERSGGSPAQLAIERAQLEFLSQSLEALLKNFEALGVVLKGLAPWLADFPFLLEGREVYLCWQQGEKNLRHFHGTDEGFADRKALPKNLLPH